MGSTGEADKKRRHFSSISPSAAGEKKQSHVPLSEEKKLDVAVLQFQNHKLAQKLETQKVEINALEEKYVLLKDTQKSHVKTLAVVSSLWEELVDNLESRSICTLDFVEHGKGFECHQDGESASEGSLLSRLLETGAAEHSSGCIIVNQTEDGRGIDGGNMLKANNILHNVVASFDDLNGLKHRLYAASQNAVLSIGQDQKVAFSSDLQSDVKNLRIQVLKLHLKHRDLAGELQSHRDTDARNKAVLKHVKGELESTASELEESNHKLALLKTERDVVKGQVYPVLNWGNNHVSNDKSRDNQRDLLDMESTLKELVEESESRLQELRRIHDDKLNTLKHISTLQSNLKNVNYIRSSQAYRLLKHQLAKAKADVAQYQALYEKFQVEKESLYWREKECHMKHEIRDVLRRSSSVSNSRISDLEVEIQRHIKERNEIESKLGEASKEPGMKSIITEFKALVSSFPEKMESMQNQLAKHKEAAADVHSLKAYVESLTTILDRKSKEFETLTSRSTQQNAEIQKLQSVIKDLRLTETDMKLFLEMHAHQSTDTREVSEARSSEIKAWAHVQSLNASLDEKNLELRVKAAIEAEAKAQQMLAASEAEIAELRQKLEASRRKKTTLSDTLKSKNEETEAYLAEIETIGQAYDDMQTQNQQLLQQITERDDYNVKLVLEGVRARQQEDTLLMEKHLLEKTTQQSKKTFDFLDFKAVRIEDQLKAYSDQLHKLNEDKVRNAASRENTHRKLSDARKSCQQVMVTLEEAQSQVEKSRENLAGLQIELEKERFARKMIEDDMDAQRRKAEQLKSHVEGSSLVNKLKLELREYTEILKCSVCLDRRKEVVVTKCYHLFCSPCVQKIVESRSRKCPTCATSFGTNDVKPVYI